MKLPESVSRRRSPNWPIKPSATEREAELWRRFWRMGQSIMWEAQHQEMMLALYVRLLTTIEGDLEDTPASKITQARIMAEDLGISLSGMLRHKWRYATVEEMNKASEDAQSARGPERQSSAAQLAQLFPADPDDDE